VFPTLPFIGSASQLSAQAFDCNGVRLSFLPREDSMPIRYWNERGIVILSTTIPLHGDEEAGAIMR